MDILVIGATRGIGRQVVLAGLARGHRIRAMARSAAEMEPREGLTPISGDATRAEDLRAALDGAGAVIQTLGIPPGLRARMGPTTLFSDATRALLPLMEASGPRRLVAVTGFGTGDSRDAMSTVERIARDLLLGRAYADKAVQERLIRDSALDWTILRPGILTNNRASGRPTVIAEPERFRNGLVSRADVAAVALDCAQGSRHLHEAPVVVR
ncbi:MAG: NAD(P)-dependent oxidoreductase [Paracoccaceae bacterium]